ncbi:MAG: anthranilate synthase component I, partial [Clostridiales Family XIII bacterium]|nr:anthranilate synthase component I [Clostridiales Family XIII bacterium]
MIFPNKYDINEYLGNFRLIPIAKIFNNKDRKLSPDDAFLRLKKISKQCFILDSAASFDKNGRWTFLGFNPKLEISCKDFKLMIKNGTTIKLKAEHPNTFIREILDENKAPKIKGMPPFTGGLVGYFSFDYIMYEEPILKLEGKDEENFKDVDLMLFDKVLVFDNFKKEILIIVNIKTDSLEENYYNALTE